MFVDWHVTSARPRALPLLDGSTPPSQLDAPSHRLHIGMTSVTGTLTRSDGTFELEVPQATRFLVAYTFTHAPRIVPLPEEAGTLRIALGQGSRLAGRVVSEQGLGLPGLPVYVRPRPNEEAAVYGRGTVTDDAGRFVVQGLDPGVFEVRVGFGGLHPPQSRVTVAPGDAAHVTLDAGAAVVLRVAVRAEADLAPQLVARVIPIDDVSTPARLGVEALGYRMLERAVSAGELATGRVDWDVSLERADTASRLTLVLRDAQGAHLSAAHGVHVRTVRRPNSRFHVTTRRGNDLELPLLIPGRYTLEIEVDGKGKRLVDVGIGEGESRRMEVTLRAP